MHPPNDLTELAELGPFFALDRHSPDTAPAEPWRSMADLVDGDALTVRIAAVRTALAAAGGLSPESIEPRVAASIAHLGLVARLISPVLGLAVLTGGVPEVQLRHIRWQPVLGGPFPLSLPVDAIPPRRSIDPIDIAATISRRVLAGPVAALVEATRQRSVSVHIVWGNVASAVNGASTMIAAARPALAADARVIADRLLATPPLRGTATSGPDGFRRRSCCLIYRVAPNANGPVCGDCVLTR
ncbi:MAG TPA: (2Fe-2S)-binding protein [Mycobacteriales bacterium]|nr:(2Fe-2S)-binding protein [Mycobacteriales bacterium]